MFINFGFNDIDIDNYTISVQLGNQIIQKQTLQAPPGMAQQQFMQLVQQVARDNRPIQVKCTKIYYTEKDKPQEQYLSFSNNTFIKFENENS